MRKEQTYERRVRWVPAVDRLISFLDDFNRVILSMRRGQEFTDYVNASFIDVSRFLEKRHVDVAAQTELTECVCSGLQTEGLLHRHSGPSPPHRGRLLEDGVGMEMSLHRHAHGAPGEGAGEQRMFAAVDVAIVSEYLGV